LGQDPLRCNPVCAAKGMHMTRACLPVMLLRSCACTCTSPDLCVSDRRAHVPCTLVQEYLPAVEVHSSVLALAHQQQQHGMRGGRTMQLDGSLVTSLDGRSIRLVIKTPSVGAAKSPGTHKHTSSIQHLLGHPLYCCLCYKPVSCEDGCRLGTSQVETVGNSMKSLNSSPDPFQDMCSFQF